MIVEKKGHRCVDCPQQVEHLPSEICPSCGRCDEHCRADGHDHMSKTETEETC